jgi:hypothetical protein
MADHDVVAVRACVSDNLAAFFLKRRSCIMLRYIGSQQIADDSC